MRPFTLLNLITPAADLSTCSPLLFFLFVFPAALPYSPFLFFILLPLLLLRLLVPFYSSFYCYPCCCSIFLSPPYSSFSYYPCCYSVFLFRFTLLYLITLLLICHLVPFYSFFSLYFLLLCLIPLYSALSYYPCCCSVFLFPFTLLSLCIPCCLAFFPLLSFILLPLLLLWVFPFSLLSLCINCCHYSSFSYFPCCCSVCLLPFILLSLSIPCCSALFHLLLSLFIIHADALSSGFPLLFFIL